MADRGRVLGRRRQANAEGRERLCEVWATPEVRAQLEERRVEAGGITMPRLLVEAGLSGGGDTPSERRRLLIELFALRRVLAGVATNVNQAARAAHQGGFPVEEARAAYADVHRLAGPGGRIDAAIDLVAAEGVRS